MDSLLLSESEDALRRLDLRDAMDRQAHIERQFNPLSMSRIRIFRDGCVDGVGLAAVRYQSRYLAPTPLWARVIVRAWEYLTLREHRGSRRVTQ